MVYFELGRLPLSVIRKLRMFKYWFNLLNLKNCILYNCLSIFTTLGQKNPSNKFIWPNFIKKELESLGLGHI